MRRWTTFLLLIFITACRSEEPAAMGFVQGDFAYIASENRVLVLNIADPANPQQIGSFAFANPVPSSPQPTATP